MFRCVDSMIQNKLNGPILPLSWRILEPTTKNKEEFQIKKKHAYQACSEWTTFFGDPYPCRGLILHKKQVFAQPDPERFNPLSPAVSLQQNR
ncbi:MAG: hypothetical protein ACI8Z1_002239 [Candidatus Azotimanducaceae bacterium]|jgi:hypothetical protein